MDTAQIVGIILAITIGIIIVVIVFWTLDKYLQNRRLNKRPVIGDEASAPESSKPKTGYNSWQNEPGLQHESASSHVQPRSRFVVREKFAALRFLSLLIKVIAVITGITGCVGAILTISGVSTVLGKPTGLQNAFGVIGTGIFGILVSIIVAVLIYSWGDFIQCIIDIEHNTRKISINSESDLSS
ncbi:hypothetical protein Dform_00226 [Dehalogenimonas formicexedens]|uniref:Uncharacterized protein n=1 Tax=Dehalogenimonas formicexedens TaxID=1839801 RepID=A0A1P8F532_9CHLR|nr:hypothetical protein [Dehalogenimonas formicexedens]APV43589.1 hypothetical protein Dform_00226 [Dehalogenimonas formicexedens]